MDRFEVILKRLRAASGFSQIEVAEMLTAQGVSVTNKSVSKWEQGASKPEVMTFLRLCRLYGVRDPYTVFLGNENALNSIGLQRISEYTGLLMNDPRFTETAEPTPARVIPLYDMPASAGVGVFLDYADFIDIEVDDSVPYDVDYALRISGDSMWPSYDHGQVVYVRKQERLHLGEIGIFVLNSEVYCKELGRGELISHNEEYKPISVSQYDAFYVLGKVLN